MAASSKTFLQTLDLFLAGLPDDPCYRPARDDYACRPPGLHREGIVMLYTPRTLAELDVIFQLVVDSYNYVMGRAVSAAEMAARAG